MCSLALRAGLSLAAITALAAGRSTAAPFDLDPVTGAFDTQITAGIGIRTSNPSCSLVGDPSACGGNANTSQGSASDNGDLNYKSGRLFTGYLKGTSELLLKDQDLGLNFMGRTTYLYDPAAGETERTNLYKANSQIVYNFRLLDLWASKTFSIGDKDWRVRVGNQAINWGESYFTVVPRSDGARTDRGRDRAPGHRHHRLGHLPSPGLHGRTAPHPGHRHGPGGPRHGGPRLGRNPCGTAAAAAPDRADRWPRSQPAGGAPTPGAGAGRGRGLGARVQCHARPARRQLPTPSGLFIRDRP